MLPMLTKNFALTAILWATYFFACSSPLRNGVTEDTITYYDGHLFDIVGRYHSERHYFRFPEKFRDRLRENVWKLGQNTAGVGIRFRTNASTIIARWTVLNDASLPHMPATGVKGIDLYTFYDGQWHYVRTGFPSGKTNQYTLLSNGDGVSREFLLNLPLYDGIETVQIGVNTSATITPAKERILLDQKPVVYYGTSIAQGGCASRPGLAFTNIVSRTISVPFINLGFSGNGTIETSVGEAMTEVDAALYVIDCNPNTAADLIYDRIIALVQQLKKSRPNIPVLLVEGFLDESGYINPAARVNDKIIEKQNELRRAFNELRNQRISKLFYQKGEELIGTDHEGTVDGIHPNDIGMMRIADALGPVIQNIVR
jgi:lysophospholipase L1-like esterase